MLKKNVLDKLNAQINSELSSAYLYYSMSAYFEHTNLKGFANWMKVQAQEELAHVDRIFNYINDRSARVVLKAVGEPKGGWSSPLDAMEDAYRHECEVSGQINECVSLALKENDHSTNAFLQWFVAEQIEEEAAADDIVQKLKLIGDNTSALYLIDSELGRRTFVGGGGGGATA